MGEDWRDDLDAQVDWPNGRSLAFQVDGNDLVHVNDIDHETGDASVTVFASTDPQAPIIFQGTVNIRQHLAYRCPECRAAERHVAGGELCQELRQATAR